MSTPTYEAVRKVISDAYYEARNNAGTMETAADAAARGVMALFGQQVSR